MALQKVQLTADPMHAVQFAWQGLQTLSVGSTKDPAGQTMQVWVAASMACPGKQALQFEVEPTQVRQLAEQGRHSPPTKTVPPPHELQRSEPGDRNSPGRQVVQARAVPAQVAHSGSHCSHIESLFTK